MRYTKSVFIKLIIEIGLFSLMLTLFLMSFPRSWSLYPLGVFLFCGLIIWLADLKNIWQSFLKSWYIVVPPVIYFLIHVTSLLFQGGNIKLLEDRLMFVLIPLFGIPLFINDRFRRNVPYIFNSYIIGITVIVTYLVVKVVFDTIQIIPADMHFFKFAVLHKYRFFTSDISVLEHPTYLSMKLIWVIILLFFFYPLLHIKMAIRNILLVFLSVFLILLASKAALVLWVSLIIYISFRQLNKGLKYRIAVLVFLPVFLTLVGLSTFRIVRINEFVNNMVVSIQNPGTDWKNFDQRTREWYVSIQLIKENPIAGTGISQVQEKMAMEFRNNSFEEEADLKMNSHNQFLEAQVTFGIAGTFSLILMLLIPVIFRERVNHDCIVLFFITLFTYFLMF